MDNQSWISMYAYLVENWRRQPILLNLEKVVEGGTSNNFTNAIVRFLINLGGLSMIDVVNKAACFGAIGVTNFQGLKIDVTIQLMNKHNPFFVGIHCMAHRCNLVMQTFSSLFLVAKIEGFFFLCILIIVNPLKNTLNTLSWLK
jgi:hypothetical protein